MNSPVFTIARFSVLEAVRGKIIYIIFTLMALALLSAMFIGQTALIETRESQVAIMSGFLRLTSVLAIIFFVVASISRDFQDKSIELLFAIDIPRYQVFIGKFLGFYLLAFMIGFVFAIGLVFYSDFGSVIIWSFSLWLELSLVALMSLVFILSLENVAISLIASIGVYALMRFMPAIQSMGEGPLQDGVFNQFMNAFLDLIGMLLPRLDHFAQSAWLMVSAPNFDDVTTFLAEFVLFVILFSVVGIIDLKRKAI